MLYLDEILGLAVLALYVFCIVDVIMTPDGACRNVPKLLWLFIVIVLPTIGSVVWLVAGRPRTASMADSGRHAGAGPQGFPEYERPGRAPADSPDDDAEFLRQCRERAQEQRRRYQQRHRDDQG